jgi:rod shape-determining protein MreB
MKRWSGPAGGFSARHRHHALALDAGADLVRMWLPDGELISFPTPGGATRLTTARTDAAPTIVAASRHAIRRRLPRITRRRRGGFCVAATVSACASGATRRRLQAELHQLNRDQPVLLMDAPLAAAAGAGVDTASALPRVVLDVGVHGSEAAIIAEGRVLDAAGCPEGCHAVERAILGHLYRRHHILATPRAGWQALHAGAATVTDAHEDSPHRVQVSPAELAADISGPIAGIVTTVRRLTERGAAVLDRDPLEHGVLLVGGGALVPQLARTIRAELGTQVHIPRDPRRVAARGVGLLVAEAERHPRLWDN